MNDCQDRVWAAIDATRLHQTLIEALDIYSPSGKEEDIQLFFEERLLATGCRLIRQTVEEERFNLLATMGDGPPQLLLVGHVDTVPAWDWEEFGAVAEEGIIRGLGSADMKGGCVAMVEAWLALATLPEKERPPVGLLLVVGEEENGDGSSHFLGGECPPWVVIGEPTGLTACLAHYGYLEAGFVTSGRRIHSSLPELGHNAVESMLRVLLHLARDPLFDRTESGVVYSIRELSSSRAGFVVPDRCEAWIDLHLPPAMDPEAVAATIRRQADSARELVPGLDLEVAFDFASRGYDLGPQPQLWDALASIYPGLGLTLRRDAFRSHSDGNLFFAAGVKPLILGPGALETAHTPDEQTSFADVVAAAKIYAALALAVKGAG
ncbi:M20 family metallopeptidase [Desulfuromonas carbonis]|uniref:M20 family metallopeptidase n=1 Tax=Desulfuromonas sp. DDH964 TaxID=1823759 RepID=UPI00078CD162|nr:M20/M25/M40 family metallo-hydrolase [Desulfuromonas sp. DDH964]AMV73846.1 Acetylornithine deacetylase [Desulfuromonas sp. DDH964]